MFSLLNKQKIFIFRKMCQNLVKMLVKKQTCIFLVCILWFMRSCSNSGLLWSEKEALKWKLCSETWRQGQFLSTGDTGTNWSSALWENMEAEAEERWRSNWRKSDKQRTNPEAQEVTSQRQTPSLVCNYVYVVIKSLIWLFCVWWY